MLNNFHFRDTTKNVGFNEDNRRKIELTIVIYSNVKESVFLFSKISYFMYNTFLYQKLSVGYLQFVNMHNNVIKEKRLEKMRY